MVSLLYFHFFSRKVFPLTPASGALLTTFIWCCPIRINFHSNKLSPVLICLVYLLTPAQWLAGSLWSESPHRGALLCHVTSCLGSLPFSLTLCPDLSCTNQCTAILILAQTLLLRVARFSKMRCCFWQWCNPFLVMTQIILEVSGYLWTIRWGSRTFS